MNNAEMYYLIADMYSVNAQVLAMQAANELRKSQGLAQAYSEAAFMAASEGLSNIADKLKELAING